MKFKNAVNAIASVVYLLLWAGVSVALGLGVSMLTSPTHHPIRVLCVGDSLTLGYAGHHEPSEGGYRRELATDLGSAYTFVGGEHGPFGDHEGHGGWRADQLAAQLPFWLPVEKPDVVVLMAGTNDLIHWDANSLKVSIAAEDVDECLVALRGYRVIVVTPPPMLRFPDGPRRDLCGRLAIIVRDHEDNGERVTLCDTRKAIRTADLCDDQLHLSNKGYAKLGDAIAPFVR